MAELLSYDNGPDTVSTAENLTEDEQDSLEVGTKLVEEQEALLAGKYKNAEELEKAYVELQQKFGSNSNDEEPSEVKSEEEVEKPEDSDKSDETKEDESNDEVGDDYSLLEKLWEEAQTEYTDETTDKLGQLELEDVVNMHLAYRKNVEDNYIPQRTLSEQETKDLQDVVGGAEGYKQMIDWADGNLSKPEIDMFNQVMDRGDPLAAFFAIRALSYRYEDSTGSTGEMVTGTAPKESKNIFRSQAEVVAAMSDKRYDNDPAYRNDVMEKLKRSPNVEF